MSATVSDPDGGITGTAWQWYRGTFTADDVPTAECADNIVNNCLIEDAVSSNYTPTMGDIGKMLTAGATYKDKEPNPEDTANTDADESRVAAQASSERPVQSSDPANLRPGLTTQDLDTIGDQSDTTSRSVSEAAKKGDAIGAPVTAVDNMDLLIYTLSGTDGASFSIGSGLDTAEKQAVDGQG